MTDEYNGWPNRETWALQLHLSNDEGLYNMTLERVREAQRDAQDPDDAQSGHWIGGIVKTLWEELTDPDEELMSASDILAMVSDIGSKYRVDWDRIGDAWVEMADED